MSSPSMVSTRTGARGEFVAEGVWLEVWAELGRHVAPRPGLFLDRDGVVVEEVHYLHRATNVRLQSGGAALIRDARAAGIPVAVVTNQSGIGRGLYGWDDFHAVEAEIRSRLAAEGASLDAVAACPFHPEFTPGWLAAHAHWRKPGPGMVLLLGERLGIDLARSWLVGDKASDAAAARAAGLAGAVHVLTGHGARFRAEAEALAGTGFEVVVAADIAATHCVLDRLTGALL